MGDADGRPDMLASMTRRLLGVDCRPSGEPPTIHLVPPNIRQCHADAYEPQVLSIGAYHHGKPSLEAMEKHKWRYLRDLLSRNLPINVHSIADHEAQISAELDKFIEAVRELETRARQCYSERTDNLGSDGFVKMLVLDGSFLVELLIKFYNKGCRVKEDPIFAVSWILPLIRRDVLKLENQIPFFVLERIFSLAKKPPFRSRSTMKSEELPPLKEISFAYLMWKKCTDTKTLYEGTFYHLLHLYDQILLPAPRLEIPDTEPRQTRFKLIRTLQLLPPFRSFLPRETNNQPCKKWPASTIPSAMELQEAGIRFKCKQADSFLDVGFKDGALEIPSLSVVDATESIFRNLIAFEQCCSDDINPQKHFTSYALFLDCIVNSREDVAILKGHGIIENKLGSEEQVALLLEQLCKEIIIPFQSHRFAELFEKVNEYYGSTWNKNWARLKRDYFRNPWTSISVGQAAVLFFFNFMQVLYAALSHSCSRNQGH